MSDETPDPTWNPMHEPRFRPFRWLRNRFFTGVIVALPIIAVVWVVRALIGTIDDAVWSVVPARLNPAEYFYFPVWVISLVVAVIGLTILGIFASNQVGKSVIDAGERVLARVPVISPVYNGLKQIINTIAQQRERAFRDVCLIEYPRRGLWAIGFVTADLKGAPRTHLGDDYVCVFVPTTPNPTSGFLLFVPKSDITLLDMTPEEGAKMIISGGMVSSNESLEDYKTKLAKKKPLKDETIADVSKKD